MPEKSDKTRVGSVLIVACAFPPTGGAGVQRAAKFAKYLSRLGWKVVVWSADYVPMLPRDETLLEDLPPEVDQRGRPPLDPTRRLERWLAPLEQLFRRHPEIAAKIDGIAWRLGRLGRWFLARCLPDDQLIWALLSYRELLRLVRRERVDVIFSTFSPASNHLLAWMLKRRTGLPWVADFRDLWTDDCAYTGRWAWRRYLDRRLEQRFLVDSDAVIAVSDAQRDILADRLPDQGEKFHCVTNGLDFEDFDELDRRVQRRRTILTTDSSWALRRPRGLKPAAQASKSAAQELQPAARGQSDSPVAAGPSKEKFTLTYVGQFRERRVSPAYFEGIRRLLTRNPQCRGAFELRVVGQISVPMRERAQELEIPLVATGYVPHIEALWEMVSADVLLLSTAIGANASSLMPGKVFEYLGSQRPILVIGESDSTVVRLLSRLGVGVCVARDAEAIAEVLAGLWQSWKAGRLPPGCERDTLVEFGRDALAVKLSRIMSGLIGRPVIDDSPISKRQVAVSAESSDDQVDSVRPEEVVMS